MRRSFAVFCSIPAVLCLFWLTALPAVAKDDKTYYGDGTAAQWEDISPYLSPLYKNTPYINISDGATGRKFYFNIELFSDLGVYVYGDPSSVQFSGTVNDFKSADYGYFRVQSGGASVKGEYRYLGYSLNGVPMTNTRFPNEVYTDFSDMTLMKYSELPDNLKETYHVKGIDNSAYAAIRDLIEAPDSPVWNFENMNNGLYITLRERLEGFGLMQNGTPAISLLDYAIVYSWAETGGVIRVFYQSKTNKEVIRYATFTGPVSVEFVRKVPALTASLSGPSVHPNRLGKNAFFLASDQDFLSLRIDLRAALWDRYTLLSEFEKAYTYYRYHLESFTLFIDNRMLQNTELIYHPNDVTARGHIEDYRIPASALTPGRNTVVLRGEAVIQLGARTLSFPCQLDLTIMYESEGDSAVTQPPAVPTPQPSTIVPTQAPVPTERNYTVSRKW